MTRKAIAANPAVDDPQYAAGPIRAGTDLIHSAVAAFQARHPEYERLGIEGTVQAMSTYRTPEEEEEQEKLDGEGVPRYWRRGDDAEDDYDMYDSLGRI